MYLSGLVTVSAYEIDDDEIAKRIEFIKFFSFFLHPNISFSIFVESSVYSGKVVYASNQHRSVQIVHSLLLTCSLSYFLFICGVMEH